MTKESLNIQPDPPNTYGPCLFLTTAIWKAMQGGVMSPWDVVEFDRLATLEADGALSLGAVEGWATEWQVNFVYDSRYNEQGGWTVVVPR